MQDCLVVNRCEITREFDTIRDEFLPLLREKILDEQVITHIRRFITKALARHCHEKPLPILDSRELKAAIAYLGLGIDVWESGCQLVTDPAIIFEVEVVRSTRHGQERHPLASLWIDWNDRQVTFAALSIWEDRFDLDYVDLSH